MIPWAFTENMGMRLYWYATEALYRLLWEEAELVLSCRGMICDSTSEPANESRIVLQGGEEPIAGSVPHTW